MAKVQSPVRFSSKLEWARKALELDRNLAEAHTSLGGVLWRHWKWEEAEAELRRALELEPNYAEGYRVYGTFLMMLRRVEESTAALRRARELDPLSPTIGVEYAGALTWAGRFDEALDQLERTRELDTTFFRTYQGIAFVHAARKDWTGAITSWNERRRVLRADPRIRGWGTTTRPRVERQKPCGF